MLQPHRANIRGRSRLRRYNVHHLPTSAPLTKPTEPGIVTDAGTAREPEPSRDLDPEFIALHQRITERNARILYRGTDIASYNDPRALLERG